MHPYLFISTLKDMLRPMRIFVWVLLGIVLGLVALLWSMMSGGDFGLAEYGVLARIIVFRIVALSAAMFTMSVVAQDIEQKTIVYTLTRPITRPVTIISRTLAAIITVTLMSWISLVCIALVMLGPSFVTYSAFWMDMLIMLLGAAAYCSLFVFITLVMNRAMLLILCFAFIWEWIVPNLQGEMYYLSINTYMNSLSTQAGAESSLAASTMQSSINAIPPIVSVLVLLGLFAFFMTINSLWFQQFSFLPREDAE